MQLVSSWNNAVAKCTKFLADHLMPAVSLISAGVMGHHAEDVMDEIRYGYPLHREVSAENGSGPVECKIYQEGGKTMVSISGRTFVPPSGSGMDIPVPIHFSAAVSPEKPGNSILVGKEVFNHVRKRQEGSEVKIAVDKAEGECMLRRGPVLTWGITKDYVF